MEKVTLVRLTQNDREQFIKDNQEAFNYGALEEFGRRDTHFEEDFSSINLSIFSLDTVRVHGKHTAQQDPDSVKT